MLTPPKFYSGLPNPAFPPMLQNLINRDCAHGKPKETLGMSAARAAMGDGRPLTTHRRLEGCPRLSMTLSGPRRRLTASNLC